MTLYPDATAGEAYGDMSKVDGKLSLKVGCIQIVYVHKFFMSLLVSLFLFVFISHWGLNIVAMYLNIDS